MCPAHLAQRLLRPCPRKNPTDRGTEARPRPRARETRLPRIRRARGVGERPTRLPPDSGTSSEVSQTISGTGRISAANPGGSRGPLVGGRKSRPTPCANDRRTGRPMMLPASRAASRDLAGAAALRVVPTPDGTGDLPPSRPRSPGGSNSTTRAPTIAARGLVRDRAARLTDVRHSRRLDGARRSNCPDRFRRPAPPGRIHRAPPVHIRQHGRPEPRDPLLVLDSSRRASCRASGRPGRSG